MTEVLAGEGDEFIEFAPIFVGIAQRRWGIRLFSRSGSPPSPPQLHGEPDIGLSPFPGRQTRFDRVDDEVPSHDEKTLAWRPSRATLALAVDQVPAFDRRRPNSTFASPAPQFICGAGDVFRLCVSRRHALELSDFERSPCVIRLRVILAVMTTRLLAAFVLAIAPVACTSMSTYPPTAGKAVSTPNVAPGPEVMAGAIKEAHRITGLGTPVVFNLPAGLQESTWSKVARLVADGRGDAKPMEPGSENVFSVQQLRISGGVAEVDVVYPERGVYQLMTVKFKGGAALPWRVDWAYRWVIPATAPIANTPETMYAKKDSATTPASSAPSTEIVGETTTEPAAASNPGE